VRNARMLGPRRDVIWTGTWKTFTPRMGIVLKHVASPAEPVVARVATVAALVEVEVHHPGD
jgi:hypothetical protein